MARAVATLSKWLTEQFRLAHQKIWSNPERGALVQPDRSVSWLQEHFLTLEPEKLRAVLTRGAVLFCQLLPDKFKVFHTITHNYNAKTSVIVPFPPILFLTRIKT